MSEVLAPGGISLGTDQSFIPRCAPFLSDMNIDAVALEGTSGKLSSHPCGSGCERQSTLALQFPSCRKTGFELPYAYSYNHGFPTALPIRGNSLPGSLSLMTARSITVNTNGWPQPPRHWATLQREDTFLYIEFKMPVFILVVSAPSHFDYL